jgi:rhizosphere induced protein
MLNKSLLTRFSISLLFSVGGLAVFLTLLTHAAETFPLVPFQGRLLERDGKPVSDGERLIQFEIFDAPAAEATRVWNGEQHLCTVNNGVFNVLLGSKSNLSDVDFSKYLYLQITADAQPPGGPGNGTIDQNDPPLLPRQVIVPLPFAVRAGNALQVNGRNSADVLADLTALKSELQALRDSTVTSLVPIGTIVPFGGTKIPEGWLPCNGDKMPIVAYQKLFDAIGTSWGQAAVDTFRLPDLRGRFLRGLGAGSGLDPDEVERVDYAGRKVGGLVGSYQNDALEVHHHEFVSTGNRDYARNGTYWGEDFRSPNDASSRTTSQPIGAKVSSETRPKNAAVLYIIRAF